MHLYYMQINFVYVKDVQQIHLFSVISVSKRRKINMQKAEDLFTDDLLIGEIH